MSLPFWPFEYFKNPKSRFLQKNLAALWVLIWGILTASHQAYVEFFKFQIIPFHLTYLTDRSFLVSNSSGMIATSTGLLMALSFMTAYWVRSPSKFRRKRNVSILLGVVVLGSVWAHTSNIRWRVNWFIIEPLQTNYLEALYSNLGKKPTVTKLSESETNSLTAITGSASPLQVPASHTPGDELKALSHEIFRLKSQNRPVLIAVVVAESLRDADFGPRESDGESLTPSLDRMAAMGVRFRNMYSSGPVTRGGQEAVWCGTPSATDTSLMRSFPDAAVDCLPAILKKSPGVETFWIHGGDELFDSQMAFWRKQGVKNFVTKSDFNPKAPRTGWGISDLALFDKATSVITEAAKSDPKNVLVPMILTVTNHIPWVTPSDASIDLRSKNFTHEQFKTISYFDESFDLFAGNLKQAGLWDSTLLVVIGDHGNLEPTWRQPYADDPMKWERLLSHVGALLTGGIIERLRGRGDLPAFVESFTSQTQIMPFIARLAAPKSTDVSYTMDRPLFETSPWPVSSDLNQYLFLPRSGQRLAKEDVLAGKISAGQQDEVIASLRYRAWLEFLYNNKNKI
jgi:hypothetical protein